MMRVSLRVLLLGALVLHPGGAAAQELSGDWTLVDSVGGNAAWSSPLGQSGSITQSTDTLTLTPTVFRSNFQGQRVYRLDGSEVRNDITNAVGEVRAIVGRLRKVGTAFVVEDGPTVFTLTMSSSGQLEILKVSSNLWPEGTANTHRYIYRRTP